MEKINSSTVIVNTSDELKEILENDNNYDYIYLGNDINIDFKITINPNKNKITIDGTYLNERHTYRETSTVDSTDIITACSTNYHIIVKNINIVNISRYGIIYVPLDINCCNVLTEYTNVTFNGVEMIYNPYGKSKIIDCNITIERTLGVETQEVCESDIIEIGGTTTISSTSSRFTLFYYVSDAPNPTLRFLPNSNVTLTSTNKELILGTNIVFEILNDAVVNLTTANGFSTQSNQGATDT